MTRRNLALIKALVIVACVVPFAWVAARAFGYGGDLGANPVQMVLHTFGKTGLNLLILTLAITPIRKQTGLNWLVALRRTLGLAAFFYILLHAITYAVLDQGLAWQSLLVDVAMRPYITVGFLALVLMVPLAVTSTNAMQRRLRRRWVQLHRLVYLIGILGAVHFLWLVKIDIGEPLIYAAILTLLFAVRVAYRFRGQGRAIGAGAAGPARSAAR
jgi:sulfoxide reductase heme-binding subunit YedZ